MILTIIVFNQIISYINGSSTPLERLKKWRHQIKIKIARKWFMSLNQYS